METCHLVMRMISLFCFLMFGAYVVEFKINYVLKQLEIRSHNAILHKTSILPVS